MKTTRFFLILAFVIALALPMSASAQGSLTYNSGFQLQNLDTDNTAAIVITFYNQDGSEAASVPDTIAAGSSNTYFPLEAVGDGFNGSVVVSSDREIVAIANVLANGFLFGASYGGFSEGAAAVNLPLLMKDNYDFSTWFNVQNTGSEDAAVTVTYDTGDIESATIAPGAAATFDQATNPDLVDGWVGSASVTSDQDVVAAVMQVGPTTLLGYNGFTGASEYPVMPLVNANNYGYVTGIQIQNTSGTDTEVTIAYTPSTAGTACTESGTVPANSSATFALYAFTYSGGTTTSDCVMGETFVGSAEVTDNSTAAPLVVIVNQLNSGSNKGAAYEGFDPDAGTEKVVMPLIMDRNWGYFTGFSVMNVGDAATDVVCTYTDSTHVDTAHLDPGEAMTPAQLDKIADGYVGSATCVASAGGSIVGVVNELGPQSAASGDTFLVYDAFNAE